MLSGWAYNRRGADNKSTLFYRDGVPESLSTLFMYQQNPPRRKYTKQKRMYLKHMEAASTTLFGNGRPSPINIDSAAGSIRAVSLIGSGKKSSLTTCRRPEIKAQKKSVFLGIHVVCSASHKYKKKTNRTKLIGTQEGARPGKRAFC